jgi:hypothetical protein
MRKGIVMLALLALIIPVHADPIPADNGITQSNTDYYLTQDTAIFIDSAENITINLNGFNAIGVTGECIDAKIFNGFITAENYAIYLGKSNGCLFQNVTIIGEFGVGFSEIIDIKFENVVFNVASSAIEQIDYPLSSKIYIKDSIINSESSGISYPDSVYIYILENVSINTPSDDNLNGVFPVYMLRNARLKISEGTASQVGRGKIYNQHLLIINTTDEAGRGVPAVVYIKDAVGPEAYSEYYTNPSDDLYIQTDNNGYAKIWITKNLSVYRTTPIFSIQEISYSPYTAVVKSGISNTTVMFGIDQDVNYLNIVVNEPTTTLPKCTIKQMFDLNNDGSVNLRDAAILARWLTGRNVTIAGTKNCNAISFLPVGS